MKNASGEKSICKTVLLVQHPASDHLQVLKHTQVSQLLWPGIDVQITWRRDEGKDFKITDQVRRFRDSFSFLNKGLKPR